MPMFKSTYNILKKPDECEVFNTYLTNWMDSDKLILPPGGPDDIQNHWDYKREMKIEDVDIWEILCEESGGRGIYVAWLPYAEFYMITSGFQPLRIGQYVNDRIIETHYGPGVQEHVYRRAQQLNLHLNVERTWINSEDLWLYPNQLHKDQTINF